MFLRTGTRERGCDEQSGTERDQPGGEGIACGPFRHRLRGVMRGLGHIARGVECRRGRGSGLLSCALNGFDVVGRAHHRLAHATKSLPDRGLAPLDHALGTQTVPDGLECLTHTFAVVARVAPQLIFCRAHCTSSLTDSTVCCGTPLTSFARWRARANNTAATIA